MKKTLVIPFILAWVITVLGAANAQPFPNREKHTLEATLLTSIGTKIDREGDTFTLKVRRPSGQNSFLLGRISSLANATPQRKAMMRLRIFVIDGSAGRAAPRLLAITSLAPLDDAATISSGSTFTSTRGEDFIVKKGTIFRLQEASEALPPLLSAAKSKTRSGENAIDAPPARWTPNRDGDELIQ